MGGKRRDFDGQFAMIEVGFLTGDPRLLGLPVSARWVYITLWCLAVKERREVLPDYWRYRSVARAAGVDPSTARQALGKLLENSLIDVSNCGDITVCGVKAKHPNLTWKLGGISHNMHPHKHPQTETETETETESESEERLVRKKRAPTPAEKAFCNGFEKAYGHQPTIDRGSAIALNQKVSQHGIKLVTRKIELWWESPAGAWVRDARTIGAFLRCFDRIVDPSRSANGQAKARFNRIDICSE